MPVYNITINDEQNRVEQVTADRYAVNEYGQIQFYNGSKTTPPVGHVNQDAWIRISRVRDSV